MDLSSILPVALSALARNKLRTALTMLGITIGIAAVICTVAIGEGGSSRIREQLQNLGDNFVWVEAGSRNVQGVRTGTGATKTLTARDMKAIPAKATTASRSGWASTTDRALSPMEPVEPRIATRIIRYT